VLYLDVGDVGNAYAQVAPVGTQLGVYTSSSKYVITKAENSISYISPNGLETSNITFSFQEGQEKVLLIVLSSVGLITYSFREGL
jgi:hypothetical protein